MFLFVCVTTGYRVRRLGTILYRTFLYTNIYFYYLHKHRIFFFSYQSYFFDTNILVIKFYKISIAIGIHLNQSKKALFSHSKKNFNITRICCGQYRNYMDKFYRMISFLKLRVSSLCGSTMELRRIFSDGTVTQHPRIVIDGFNLPSLLNNGGFSILANGLFGSGSLGVPSTRAQHPMVELRPTAE